MSILGSLGAAANGFVDGLERGQRMARNNAAMADEERLRKAMDEANKAGQESLRQWQKDQAPQTETRATLSSADVAAAPGFGKGLDQSSGPVSFEQQAQPGGLAQSLTLGGAQPVGGTETRTTQPKADEREGILQALSARRKALMGSGIDAKYWMDDWGKEANMRAQVRTERLDQANQRFAMNSDPSEWAKAVYPLIDDGMEFVSASPTKGVDGKQGWQFVRRDPATGEEQATVMDAEGFNKFRMSVADPKMVMQYEARQMLERYKADQGIRESQGKQEAERETNRQKSRLSLGEIAARSSQDRQTNDLKPVVLGADATLVKPDGKGGASTVAKGGGRTLGGPAANPSAANRVLNERAQAAAAIKANPGAASAIKERFKARTGKDF
ncbi:MAG: hypothetical protein WAQ08_16170 [Aquabacterium sp.]|uniref:hypothetical protein n=1 Tax=Aquabacterium sp. TaxID=1872578 RepID=UPI003BAF1A9F